MTAERAVAERIARAMCGDDHLACTYPDCGCKTVPSRLPAVLAIVESVRAAGKQEGREEAAKIADAYGARARAQAEASMAKGEVLLGHPQLSGMTIAAAIRAKEG